MTLKLQQWIGKTNICDAFTDDQLNHLGAQVVRDWAEDLSSRSEWEKRTQDGLDLAMQLAETKTWPWPNAANVKYPLVAEASIQFHARAYPEVIQGNNVVKGKVVGRDTDGTKQDRADRISKHMSYQLLEEMVEWDEDTDRMLMMLPVIGCLFRKTYYDQIRQRNVSCLRKPFSIVIHNDAKSVDDARRITDQDVYLYRNDVHERVEKGIFRKVELTYEFDEEKQAAEQFLEQHMWYDLDADGYEEPYVVTVHRASTTVVGVWPRYDDETVYISNENRVLRIEPVQYFTKYSFLPSFDGSFYDVGFGQLLQPINKAINSTVNQLLDAGTLANVQGGLVSRGIKVKGGQYRFQPGEWKQTDASPQDLRDGFFPLPVKEPSNVLFQLLGFMVEAGKRLSSVADVMTGEQAGPNEPVGTMLTRVEQGMKVFNGIYKRIYRSLKSEFKKIAKLNRDYMDDEVYFRVLDIENVAVREDYNDKDVDVFPVADPAQGTDTQRLAKAQALLPIAGSPGVNAWQVTRNYLKALKVDNLDEIQPEKGKESAMEPQPDPKMVEVQGRLAAEHERLAQSGTKLNAELEELQAKITNIEADTTLKLAQAEAAELGPQLDYYRAYAQQLEAQIAVPKGAKEETDVTGSGVDGGRVQGMEIPGGNGEGFQGAEGIPAGAGGEIPPPPFDGADLQGSSTEGGGFVGA